MADYSMFGPLAGLIAGAIVFFIILAIAVYIYTALAMMAIGKKLNYPYPWLAWIPGANVAMLFQLGKFPWWLCFGLLLMWIPILGQIVGLGILVLAIISYYRICENLKKPGWWGIIIGIVPIANWILLGILAWGKE
jgi:hypothetical protein